MRKTILLALLVWPGTLSAQSPAVVAPPAAAVPQPSVPAKGSERAVQAENNKLDKVAQQKAQQDNDALIERHNAAANRAVRGICAGCLGRKAAAPRIREEAVTEAPQPRPSPPPVRRQARIAPEAYTPRYTSQPQPATPPLVVQEPAVAQPPGNAPSAQERWWLTR